MKNKTIPAFFYVLVLCLVLGCQAKTEKGNEEKMKQPELENFLRNAYISNIERGKIPGRTDAWRITLEDGKMMRQGIFKIVDYRRPYPIGESYAYELAAYELDKLLDFNRIPPVIEKEIEGTTGSLQIILEDCIPLETLQSRKMEPPDPEAFQNSLEEINVFENLVLCSRFDLGDVLIHQQTWKVCRVDFSEAFSPTPELIPSQEITRCSKKLYQKLQKLSDEVIEAQLKNYLNDEEMSALFSRKTLIIKTLKKLIEEKGEEVVLF